MAGQRILVVDDEILIALDTQDALVGAGYTVVGPVAKLSDALQLAVSEPLDAALLDVSLDGVLIWPVAQALHQRGIPFVLVTGFGRGLDMPGFCCNVPVLEKPVRRAALLAQVTALFSSGRPQG